jgi:hypothetical protein
MATLIPPVIPVIVTIGVWTGIPANALYKATNK